jgi:hypothetical protein
MKQGIVTIVLVSLTAHAPAQTDSSFTMHLTGQCQFIGESRNAQTNFLPGKIEIGFVSTYQNLAGLRIAYKVFSNFDVAPFDAYLFLKPAEGWEFRFGQFRDPYALENISLPFKRDFIEDAAITGALSTRDFGLGLDYVTGIVQINAAIFNGEGLNKRDANKQKDFVCRVAISPVNDLLLGASFYRAITGPDSLLLHNDYVNMHFQWKRAFAFTLQGEYLRAMTSGGSQDGAYLTLGWFLPTSLTSDILFEVLARYERFIRSPLLRTNQATIGLNYYLDRSYTLRVMLNHTLSIDNSGPRSPFTTVCLYYSFG